MPTIAKHIQGFTNKKRKRKNESDRDFIFRTNKNTCNYCHEKFEKKYLCLVPLDPNRPFTNKIKSHICACKFCVEEKSTMTDREYRNFRITRKRLVRDEIVENYQEIAPRIFKKYNYTCIYCIAEYGHMSPDRTLTVDHKIPVDKGGTNEERNLCCSCLPHNVEKGDRTAQTFLESIETKKRQLLQYS